MLAAGAATAFLAVTAPFLAALARSQGPIFALRAAPVHALHYVAALAGWSLARLEALTARR